MTRFGGAHPPKNPQPPNAASLLLYHKILLKVLSPKYRARPASLFSTYSYSIYIAVGLLARPGSLLTDVPAATTLHAALPSRPPQAASALYEASRTLDSAQRAATSR